MVCSTVAFIFSCYIITLLNFAPLQRIISEGKLILLGHPRASSAKKIVAVSLCMERIEYSARSRLLFKLSEKLSARLVGIGPSNTAICAEGRIMLG